MSGSENNEKINVAFLGISSMEWTGGLYYFRNLLHAIASLEDGQIQPFVFVGKKTTDDLVKPLEKCATVVRSALFDKNSFLRNISRIVILLTGSNLLRNWLFKKHQIQVVSHSNITEKTPPYKVLNWIPDLQHFHLPRMFTEKEIISRNNDYQKIVSGSDIVIVSSHDAREDLLRSSWCHGKKIRILNFVSQIRLSDYDSDVIIMLRLQERYNFEGKFFYMPNQFWQHKNHQIVFEAVDILNKSGLEILVLSSGHLNDYRRIEHVNQLKLYINEHNLAENVRLLGLIDRQDLFTLMRFSLAVINPSLFEGWSSTVEEAKSMGKGMILSDLNVHKEQAPPASTYFDPFNAKQLAEILKKEWTEKVGGPNFDLEEQARENLPVRTRDFALAYQNIVQESLAK